MTTLNLFILFIVYFSSGYYFSRKFIQERFIIFTSIIIGFIIINSFFIGLFAIFNDIKISFYIVCLLIFISSIYSLINISNIYKIFKSTFNKQLLVYIVLAVVLICWPVFIFENKLYLHSGADDLINDVYTQVSSLINLSHYSFGRYIMHSVQYFSPTFSSILLGNSTISNILILDIIFVAIYFISIYYFASIYIQIDKKVSIGVAFFATVLNFYSTTFINYHPGTLISVPLMIFLVTFILRDREFTIDDFSLIKRLIFGFILVVFVAFTYNLMILIFFLFPLLYMYMVQKLGKELVYNKVTLTILALLYIFACIVFYYYLLNYTSYLVFENPFSLEYPGYRQWELLRSEFLLAFYWGIIPSALMGVGYPFMEYYNFFVLKYIIVIISILFTMVSIYGVYILSKQNGYIRYFSINFLLFFIPFILLLDPYYTYKLLYITQGIFVIGLYYGYLSISSKLYKMIVKIGIIFLLGLNILYLIMMNYNIFDRAAHKVEQYEELQHLNMSYKLGLANLDYTNIISYIHNSLAINHQIDSNSSNILISNFKQDISDASNIINGKELLKTEFYTIFQLGQNYLLSTDKYKQVEHYNNMPLRWIYDDIGNNRTVISELNFIGFSNKKYLKFHAYPGQSAINGLEIEVCVDENCYKYKIVGETIVNVPLKSIGKFNLKINTNEEGISLLPKEQRKLLVMISRVSFDDKIYSDNDLLELNPENDVANQEFNRKNNIVIGNGWYPQELQNMRWGSNNLELLVLNSTKDSIKIEFDLEPGPSLKELPLKVEILNEENQKIGYFEVTQRDKMALSLPIRSNERYQIIKLKVLNDIKKLSFDPRDLNLRLFSIKAVD